MTISHLDDEQLSAHLDGDGDDEAREHLGSCRRCGERLADLLFVSSRVGAPVAAPPDHVREAALHAAGAAWAAARQGAETPGQPDVVALAGRRGFPRWALPVAAAAAVLLVAIPLVGSLGDDRGEQETAATLDGRRAAGGAAAEMAPIDGGDLGRQSDPAALARAIRGALPGAASEAALAAPASPPAGGGAAVGADAPATTPAPASDRTAAQRHSAAAKTRAADRPCAGTARSTYGQGLGPLVYSALVRWQGTPAVVLAYRVAAPGGPGLDYRVLVMARQDCRLLVGQSL